MFKIGWFSSGRGAGSRDLLTTMRKSIESGEVKPDIAFVFCNRERGFSDETDKFLDLVQTYNIPLICYSSVKFRNQLQPDLMENWRIYYDREVMNLLDTYNVDLSILAGYMLVVGPEMCTRYTMINLHPAEPDGPKGTWREVIRELIANKAERTGVMMHLATPELDEGPPVTYCSFNITGDPFDKEWQNISDGSAFTLTNQDIDNTELFKLIRQHGLKREFPLIVSTVKAFSEGHVMVKNRLIVDRKGNPIRGYDLSSDINNAIEICE